MHVGHAPEAFAALRDGAKRGYIVLYSAAGRWIEPLRGVLSFEGGVS
jgi:hypothetical protein